nr:MAG TPA: hypothetical protein [Caudoviricetes sp.]
MRKRKAKRKTGAKRQSVILSGVSRSIIFLKK